MKRTKIVATIGLASEKKETLEKMIQAGMNVARLNFSHGDYQWHSKIIDTIRNISRARKIPVGILADLQGPRIRVLISGDMEVRNGEIVKIFDITGKPNYETDSKFITLDCPDIIEDIKINNEILIEDGLIKLKVFRKNRNCLETEVVNGGIVKNHKVVNIPGARLNVGAITEKDEKDLKFALSKDVDFVALSFVKDGKDIKNLKNKIKKIAKREKNAPLIVSKIERAEAIENIDEIIRSSDIIMVARGDLGIEMEESKVVIFQKEIIAKCLRAAKPVIVATQMLDSMIRNPRPTRAEVSDVSNAVIDHADAVMLSGETADGKYPVEAVEIMEKIVEVTESSPFDDLGHGFLKDKKLSVSAAVSQSAHELMKDSQAKAVVVASISGFTARMIARHRPDQEIYVVTNNAKTQNQLSIVWGIQSFILPDCHTLDALIDKSIEILKKNKLLKKNDRVVIVTGRPHVKREHMSLVKFEEIK